MNSYEYFIQNFPAFSLQNGSRVNLLILKVFTL